MSIADCRIKGTETTQQAIAVMGGGNPGALRVLCDLIRHAEKIDPDSLLGAIGPMLNLDMAGIWEHRIWMLYKDVCGECLLSMIALIRANQLGLLNRAVLDYAIDNRGDGVDVKEILAKVQTRLPQFGHFDPQAETVSTSDGTGADHETHND